MTAPLIQHSSATSEHYSPASIVEPARAVMGGIDLDPASCELANRTVRATRFYTRIDDGLAQPWAGRVWLNPPGGRDGQESVMCQWWRGLAEAWRTSEVEQAVFVVFNLGLLQTSQGKRSLLPLDFPICFPSSRIEYLKAMGEPASRQVSMFMSAPAEVPAPLLPGESPPHPSAIVYLPPSNPKAQPDTARVLRAGGSPTLAGIHDRRALMRFKKAFSPLGRCVWSREGW